VAKNLTTNILNVFSFAECGDDANALLVNNRDKKNAMSFNVVAAPVWTDSSLASAIHVTFPQYKFDNSRST